MTRLTIDILEKTIAAKDLKIEQLIHQLSQLTSQIKDLNTYAEVYTSKGIKLIPSTYYYHNNTIHYKN